MKLDDSKLISLLKSLNKYEFAKLEDYVFSPFFNKSRQINILFKILKRKYPKFKKLSKRIIFEKIYPGEKYKDKKTRDLFSRMLILTEEFLGQMKFMKNNSLINTYTLQGLAEKNLEKHFINRTKEAELELSREKIISSNYFYNKYSLSKEKRSYLEILEALGKRTSFFEGITKEIDIFTIYSIYTILKYGLILQTHERLIKHEYDFGILNEILAYIKANPLKDYPVIMILFYIIILNKEEGNDLIYFEVKKLLYDNMDFIEESDQRIILVFLFNYTQKQAVKGKMKFREENYSILKDVIERGLHPMEGNYFSENSYITTVGTALQERDYFWAEEFMEKYKNKLPPEHRANAYNYCISILNYRKGNYKIALEGLGKVSLDDFYYHIRVKNHEIRIFMELEDYEKVSFTVDSFRHFLGSNKLIPDYLRIRFLNYVNFSGRIAHAMLTAQNPKERLINFRDEIKSFDKALENKTWLLEQLGKLVK